jgi:hypothetical protein
MKTPSNKDHSQQTTLGPLRCLKECIGRMAYYILTKLSKHWRIP